MNLRKASTKMKNLASLLILFFGTSTVAFADSTTPLEPIKVTCNPFYVSKVKNGFKFDFFTKDNSTISPDETNIVYEGKEDYTLVRFEIPQDATRTVGSTQKTFTNADDSISIRVSLDFIKVPTEFSNFTMKIEQLSLEKETKGEVLSWGTYKSSETNAKEFSLIINALGKQTALELHCSIK